MALARPPRRPAAALLRRLSPLLIALACLAAGFWLGQRGSPSQTAARATQDSSSGSGSNGGHGSGGSKSAEPAPTATKTRCEDSCPGRTSNGVCDEGRPNVGVPPEAMPDSATVFEVLCDLGTDCADCGPWVHSNTDESDSWRPIAEIREKEYEVFTRQVAHPTRYFMAFTDANKDIDVSASMWAYRLFEPVYTYAWHTLLAAGCQGPGGERRLVADVGANFGYYTILAASMGCRVVAWEPVPTFAAYLKYGLLRNNLTHLVQLRERIVSSTSGGELTIVVPNRGIWGTAGINGSNIDSNFKNEGDYERVVRPVERLDEAVQEDVLIMKIDVEGYEPHVLRGGKRLFLEHSVQHAFMEYSPGVAERARNWRWFEDNPTVLMGLVRAGYTILHIGALDTGFTINWNKDGALEAMAQVTEGVLAHDVEDAWRLQDGTLGCVDAALLEGLPATGAGVFGCGSLPEGLDPQSFRSTFGYNTNLFLFKGEPPPGIKVGGPASLAPLDYDIRRQFFVPGGAIGSGHRLCFSVGPQQQVAHRCPCTSADVCGALEERVKQLAAEGKLPPFAVAGRTVEPDKMGMEAW